MTLTTSITASPKNPQQILKTAITGRYAFCSTAHYEPLVQKYTQAILSYHSSLPREL